MADGLSATAGVVPAVEIVAPEGEPLAAPLHPAFDYTRSTGPVLGAFFEGLREGRIVGSRDSRGLVHVPPIEFDPETHNALDEFVDVSEVGSVVSWTWVIQPDERSLLAKPHALALIRLDGADTALVHVVAADSVEVLGTGMRVRVSWRAERSGSIRDFYFVPDVGDDVDAAAGQGVGGSADVDVAVSPDGLARGLDEKGRLVTPFAGEYTHTAGFAERRYLRGLAEGKFIGRRRANGSEVYVPPRDWCPSDGVPMGEFVEVADVGTVTTFGIVNVPFAGQKITPPYVTAYILLDGADVPIQHLVLGCDAAEVRMGMRVRAVWKPEGERPHSMGAITHFEPTGEPDSDPESYSRHL